MSNDNIKQSGDSRTPDHLRVLEFHGSEQEIGHLHGQQLREEIGLFYDDLLEQMCTDGGTTEDDLLSYSRAHLPAAMDYAPELVDEMRGIAEGAGFPFGKVLLINCFDEVCWHGPQVLKKSLHGCTAFAATGRATVDGKCYVGQSWDVPTYYPAVFFRLVRDSGAITLILSHPGMIGGTGLSSSGLALVWTSLKSNDAGIGVPATFVVRKALQASDLGGLIGNVITASRANGMNFIAGDAIAAVDIELTATRYQVTYSHGILSRANHYESPELLGFEANLPDTVPDTYLRSGRMKELLQQHESTIDHEVMKNIYCDHASAPGSICRHESLGFHTCVSLIYDPAEGVVWASNGRPCEAGFVQYSLAPQS